MPMRYDYKYITYQPKHMYRYYTIDYSYNIRLDNMNKIVLCA